MRTNCIVVFGLLLVFSSPLYGADPPFKPAPIDDLAKVATGKTASNLKARLLAIDLIGNIGATPCYANDAVVALEPLLDRCHPQYPRAKKDDKNAPLPPENFKIWQHVIQAIAKAGGYGAIELHRILLLKDLDTSLDGDIETAAMTIQQAWSKNPPPPTAAGCTPTPPPAPPAANPPANPPGNVTGSLSINLTGNLAVNPPATPPATPTGTVTGNVNINLTGNLTVTPPATKPAP